MGLQFSKVNKNFSRIVTTRFKRHDFFAQLSLTTNFENGAEKLAFSKPRPLITIHAANLISFFNLEPHVKHILS